MGNVWRFLEGLLLGSEGNFAPPFPPIPPTVFHTGNLITQPRQNRDKQRRNWIQSERHWNHRVGKDWVGQKVLGQGGFGIVGHWKYKGNDKAELALGDICVKQVSTANGRLGLDAEYECLAVLAATDSRHFVKVYGELIREQGFGTSTYDSGSVERIFLEYCPEGDLHGWTEPKVRLGAPPITEEEMWAIFHCLVQSTYVLENGSEDLTKAGWDREIVHFDLKSSNILCSSNVTDAGNDPEHRDIPIFKMADFGLAVHAPLVQDAYFHHRNLRRGTVAMRMPEQLSNLAEANPSYVRPWNTNIKPPARTLVQNLRYGSPSNVWQIGLIMWGLKMSRVEPNWEDGKMKMFQSSASNKLKGSGFTLGYQVEIDEEQPGFGCKFSRSLNALIKECLLVQSGERPSTTQLVTRTRRGLSLARMAAGIFISPADPNILDPNKPQPDDPGLPARFVPRDFTASELGGYRPTIDKPLHPTSLMNEYDKIDVQRRQAELAIQQATLDKINQQPFRQNSDIRSMPVNQASIQPPPNRRGIRFAGQSTAQGRLPPPPPPPRLKPVQDPSLDIEQFLPSISPAPQLLRPLIPINQAPEARLPTVPTNLPPLNPPPPAHVPSIGCRIETVDFLRRVHLRIIHVQRMQPSQTIMDLKRRLDQYDCGISLREMAVEYRERVMGNFELISDIDVEMGLGGGMRGYVNVKKI